MKSTEREDASQIARARGHQVCQVCARRVSHRSAARAYDIQWVLLNWYDIYVRARASNVACGIAPPLLAPGEFIQKPLSNLGDV